MKKSNAEIAKTIEEAQSTFSALRRLDPVLQLRTVMRKKGLRNIDIAERLGVTEECVSRWLRGKANLQLDTLYKLADAVEEPLSIFVGELKDLNVTVDDSSENQPAEVQIFVSKESNVFLLERFRMLATAANDDDELIIEKEERYEAIVAVA
jgi:transcriptional regulator with XRE-family HTH domain